MKTIHTFLETKRDKLVPQMLEEQKEKKIV
jgi:hypothetical protein